MAPSNPKLRERRAARSAVERRRLALPAQLAGLLEHERTDHGAGALALSQPADPALAIDAGETFAGMSRGRGAGG